MIKFHFGEKIFASSTFKLARGQTNLNPLILLRIKVIE